MLETILVALAVAVVTSAAVGFMMQWETRLRVRRLTLDIAEFDEVINRYNKKRAAQASVEARGARAVVGNALDAAIVARHTGVDLSDDGGLIDVVGRLAKGRERNVTP